MNRVAENITNSVFIPGVYSGTSRTQYDYYPITNSYSGLNMAFVPIDPNRSGQYCEYWNSSLGSPYVLSTSSNNSTSSEGYEYDDSSNSPPPGFDVPQLSPPASGSGRGFDIESILGLNGNVRQNTCQGNRDAQIFSAYNSTAFQPAPLVIKTHYQNPINSVKRDNSEPLPDSRYRDFSYNPLITDPAFQKRKFPTNQVEVKTKRARTTFTAEQMSRLEAEFSRTQYMAGQDRVLLARLLNLRESQVKIWFQNRRIKYRKQCVESCKIKSETQKDN